MHLRNPIDLFELYAGRGTTTLPDAPSDAEKYSYLNTHIGILTIFSIFAFTGISTSALILYLSWTALYPLFGLFALTAIYYAVSISINFFTEEFDFVEHQRLILSWKPNTYPTIDIFLPTCGEPLAVIRNTWEGVAEMREAYPGELVAHSLDDAHDARVRSLAEEFDFAYHARENKGWFKKAGNLRYGYAHSQGAFIAIFDADFRPRADFLEELLPYFFHDPKLGIVQSPQYFAVSPEQNWLERGAGAVQEFFYRAVQTLRNSHGGAICVGSNAIYRRSALDMVGGTALIEHSEDVHTGFNLRDKGWHLQYVPIVLAKGLCPSELKAFFKQQYRWCSGSFSLLLSKKFWRVSLPLRTRVCFFSGFLYYLHTGIYAVLTPLIPLIMLIFLPQEIKIFNYLFLFPAAFYAIVVFPSWHKSHYGLETSSVKLAYGWAHFFALLDVASNRVMEWQPTGARQGRDKKYLAFRTCVVLFNFIPASIWVGLASYDVLSRSAIDYAPILLIGVYYYFVVLKIVLYTEPKRHPLPQESVVVLNGELAKAMVVS